MMFENQQTDINQVSLAKGPKLLFLGVLSLLFCASLLMSLFAPFPIILAAIVYGRQKAYSMAAICFGVAALASMLVFKESTFAVLYLVTIIFSSILIEIISRTIAPAKGMVAAGLSIAGITSLLVTFISLTSPLTFKQMLVSEFEKNTQLFEKQKETLANQTSKETIQIQALLSQPELLADEVLKSFPGYFFMALFFVLWVNLYLALRTRRLLHLSKEFTYSEQDLLNFKVADQFVFVLIGALVLAIWGDDWFSYGSTVGLTLIKALGIFYFCQGFGIFVRFLNLWRIFGLFRTLMIMFIVLTSAWLVALVGLFDMWVNFNRFMKRKE